MVAISARDASHLAVVRRARGRVIPPLHGSFTRYLIASRVGVYHREPTTKIPNPGNRSGDADGGPAEDEDRL